MGRGAVTKEQLKKIIKKLGAVDVTTKTDCHDRYAVYHEGKLLATLGMRRSPTKDIPHPHIPGELGVNEFFTKSIASCSKYKDDWLREIGELAEEEEPQAPPDVL